MSYKKQMAAVRNFLQLQEKKLAIHEAGHILVAAAVGLNFNYMHCGLEIDIRNDGTNIIILSDSKFLVDFVIPTEVVVTLELMRLGYKWDYILATVSMARPVLETWLRQYAQVLLAGYIAEKTFRSFRFWWLRYKLKKFTKDLTPGDLQHDLTRFNLISKFVRIDRQIYERNVRTILNTANNRTVLKALAEKGLSLRFINQTQIQEVLNDYGFDVPPIPL